MRLDGAKKWYAAAALASVLVLLAGWFLLVSPQRQSAEDIGAQAETQTANNQVTQGKINALKAQYANLPTLQKQLAIVQTRMPQTPNMPGLLRNLNAAATAAGVKLLGVTPANATALGGTGQTTNKGDSALTAPGAVQVIGVTVTVSGPFANTRLFLTSLEAMPRTFIVTGLAIARDTAPATTSATGTTTTKAKNSLTTTITGRVFRVNPGQPAAAVAKTTTGASTATNGGGA
jgi:hypothetical protein